jgi:hypothetical protein
MSEEKRKDLENYINALKQQRDELKLKIHLGKEEVRDEWDKLSDKLATLESRFEPVKSAVGTTADNVWESLKLLGGEIHDGFQRIRKSL